MKTIKLTQGQYALVDDWNFEYLNQRKWCANWNKKTKSFYAVRAGGKLMHREIMKTQRGMKCDHKNHDTLDNQESNLRNVTNSQNMLNGKSKSTNKLGQKCICPNGRGFEINIYKNGKRVFYKYLLNLEDAIVLRDEMIKKFHGEFAYK